MATKLMCGSSECEHNDRGKCQMDFVSMRPRILHTAHNGWCNTWRCDYYKVSDEHKEKIKLLGGNVRCSLKKEEMP